MDEHSDRKGGGLPNIPRLVLSLPKLDLVGSNEVKESSRANPSICAGPRLLSLPEDGHVSAAFQDLQFFVSTPMIRPGQNCGATGRRVHALDQGPLRMSAPLLRAGMVASCDEIAHAALPVEVGDGPRDFVPLGTLSSTGLNARDPRMWRLSICRSSAIHH